MSDAADPATPANHARPTATEAVLADMWHDLLGLTHAGPGDDFFTAGGTSVTVIRFLQRVEKRFGPDTLTPEQIYDDPRLGVLARVIDGSRSARDPDGSSRDGWHLHGRSGAMVTQIVTQNASGPASREGNRP